MTKADLLLIFEFFETWINLLFSIPFVFLWILWICCKASVPSRTLTHSPHPKVPYCCLEAQWLHHVLLLTQRCDSWGLLGFAILLALLFWKMSVCVSVNVTLTVSELGIGNNYLSGVDEYFFYWWRSICPTHKHVLLKKNCKNFFKKKVINGGSFLVCAAQNWFNSL